MIHHSRSLAFTMRDFPGQIAETGIVFRYHLINNYLTNYLFCDEKINVISNR